MQFNKNHLYKYILSRIIIDNKIAKYALSAGSIKHLNQSGAMNKLLIAFQMLLLVFLVGCTNEAEYVGELQNGKPHGKGSITYENEEIYDGEWKEGLKEGKGTLTSPDGGKYEGEWKNDKMEGQGTYTWPNGDKYEGEWKDGKKHGDGTILFKDGSKMEGEFRDDSPWKTTLSD